GPSFFVTERSRPLHPGDSRVLNGACGRRSDRGQHLPRVVCILSADCDCHLHVDGNAACHRLTDGAGERSAGNRDLPANGILTRRDGPDCPCRSFGWWRRDFFCTATSFIAILEFLRNLKRSTDWFQRPRSTRQHWPDPTIEFCRDAN